jgi:hypothetical protein
VAATRARVAQRRVASSTRSASRSPATPWGRQVVLAKRLAGGPDRVQRVAVGTAAAGWPLGPTHLDDPLAVLLQEPGKAGAEAARPSTAQQRRPGT